METGIIEFLNILFRFTHIVAAIMWIGNSLLFTWIEINLVQDESRPDTLGSMNMLHGGGVFFLEKRVLRPESLPSFMHRFLWQSYTTWISGFVLLVSVFYTRADTLLLDPSQTGMTGAMAVAVSVLSLAGGWVAYDRFWRSLAKNYPRAGILVCFVALLAYGAWLDTLFNGRAVYLQMGAMMGTMMSANVFFHIIPSQKEMMGALAEGREHDLALGKQAKLRSLHNHYMTFPVIFLMLSAHFPHTYGSPNNIAIAGVIMAGLVVIKHCMNLYRSFRYWKESIAGTLLIGSLLVYLLIVVPPPSGAAARPELTGEALSGRQVFAEMGCIACHLDQPTGIAPSLHRLYGTQRELADGSIVVADESYLRESILQSHARVAAGYAPTMPVYETVLTEEKVAQLVAYIREIGLP